VRQRGIHLQYSFQAGGQRGADVQNPLFDLLTAVREHGSIQHAAARHSEPPTATPGASSSTGRTVLGEPLVTWSQGQPARLTPFADRLLWAEARARSRLTPHIEALRAELERVLAEALDGSQQVLSVHASHDLALPLLREQASACHRLHIDLRFAGSMDALRALAEGRCWWPASTCRRWDNRTSFARTQAAAQAGPAQADRLHAPHPGPDAGRAATRWRLHRLADVAGRRARASSTARRARARGCSPTTCCAEQGIGAAAWASCATGVEDSHMAVAAAVASGRGRCRHGHRGGGPQPSGWTSCPWSRRTTSSSAWPTTLEHAGRAGCCARCWPAPPGPKRWPTLPGYTAHQAGEVLSLTRALPWWHFKQPRQPKQPDQPGKSRQGQGSGDA
jgi:putative molybdopterin biosynthesis protein